MKTLPLAYRVPEACSIVGAGRTSLYQAIRSGALRAVKRGRRTLILSDDLRRWLETLPAMQVKAEAPTRARPSRSLDHEHQGGAR